MDLVDMYCCPPNDMKRWDSCAWRGEPDQGNCFDGHCKINTEVAVTWAGSGGGRSCGGIDPGRLRVFCCAPPEGEALFLPVELEHLFPSPPTGDDVKTKFDLNVDDTWGDNHEGDGSDDDPNDAAFQFHVLASPTEIQTSLDKRDGSHWELFNCNDAVGGGEQTVQMICTDDSENSNCGDIHKGHGAPGTILEMPQGQGCGPGKYAVAKSLEVSKNQTLPPHLRKRDLPASATVYDLTFDYDFKRVPRDFGDTQLRIDFSYVLILLYSSFQPVRIANSTNSGTKKATGTRSWPRPLTRRGSAHFQTLAGITVVGWRKNGGTTTTGAP